jgi:hypothetical protein
VQVDSNETWACVYSSGSTRTWEMFKKMPKKHLFPDYSTTVYKAHFGTRLHLTDTHLVRSRTVKCQQAVAPCVQWGSSDCGPPPTLRPQSHRHRSHLLRPTHAALPAPSVCTTGSAATAPPCHVTFSRFFFVFVSGCSPITGANITSVVIQMCFHSSPLNTALQTTCYHVLVLDIYSI